MAELAEKFFVRTKIMYKCSDDFWNRVHQYRRERHLNDLNEAVTELLTTALEKWEQEQAGVVYSKLGMRDNGW